MSERDVHFQTRWPRDRDLRAADSDRETVAGVLRREHLAGRLDSDEFQERLERCLAAKTFAQLDDLIADFPNEQPAAVRGRLWRWPPLALVPLLIAAIVLSGGRLLWLAFPLVFLFVVRPLLGRRSGWRLGRCRLGYSSSPDARS
jgi:DUF1707 SHOCT-like domain